MWFPQHPQHITWWLIPLGKWVITPVINGIFVGLIHSKNWGELTHLRFVGSSPPSRHTKNPTERPFDKNPHPRSSVRAQPSPGLFPELRPAAGNQVAAASFPGELGLSGLDLVAWKVAKWIFWGKNGGVSGRVTVCEVENYQLVDNLPIVDGDCPVRKL